MFTLPPQHFVRLRTQAETLCVSQNRTVLAMRRDGLFDAESDHGFFVQDFTQQSVQLTLELHVDAEFADTAETKGERFERGNSHRKWAVDREDSP
jgi:hypothetical protein